MPGLAEALTLDVSDDGLRAEVVIAPGVEPSDCDEALLRAFLNENQIPIRPAFDAAVGSLIEAVHADPGAGGRAVIAEGTPPRHGEPGRFEWEPAFDPENAEADAERDGDYYNHSAFTMAETGDVLARLVEPEKGVDGETVTGKVLAARDGVAAPVVLDESVARRADGTLVALCDGAVQFRDGVLKVSTHLEINEYVDFSTGNIHFDGDVTVFRGVRDCFELRASRDVTVRGMVEAAGVEAGRDGCFDGGVAARDKGHVRVERDMSARYLDSAVVSVGRDLVVDKEIVKCSLTVGGTIRCAGGALVGGVCTVGGACEFGVLGSDKGGETHCVLGAMGDFDPYRSRVGTLAGTVASMRDKAKAEHEALVAHAADLTPTQAEQMTMLEFTLSTLEELEARVRGARARIEETESELTAVELTVHSVVHTGVRLTMGRFDVTFPDPIKGPLRITLSAAGRPLFTDLTSGTTQDLRDVARVVEIEDETGLAA